MPTYSYRCDNCGVRFDKFQKFSDKPLKRCPECGQATVRRVLQASAIVFKGSGWYATDNRSPSGQGKAKKGETDSGGPTETKPEKKKDVKDAKETKTPKHEHD